MRRITVSMTTATGICSSAALQQPCRRYQRNWRCLPASGAGLCQSPQRPVILNQDVNRKLTYLVWKIFSRFFYWFRSGRSGNINAVGCDGDAAGRSAADEWSRSGENYSDYDSSSVTVAKSVHDLPTYATATVLTACVWAFYWAGRSCRPLPTGRQAGWLVYSRNTCFRWHACVPASVCSCHTNQHSSSYLNSYQLIGFCLWHSSGASHELW